MWTIVVTPGTGTATLSNDQIPGLSETLNGVGGIWTSTDEHTCSMDSANSINGYYTFSESNTARLTLSTGGTLYSNTATTEVHCYEESIPSPEFPHLLVPAAMIIGFLGVVVLIQSTRNR